MVRGVAVDGAVVLVSGSTYRYAFSGSFAEGPVQVDFAAGSWQEHRSEREPGRE